MSDAIQWVFGLLVFVVEIIAVVEVLRSSKPPMHKLLWSLFIVFFPVIGLLCYAAFGRSRYASI